MAAKDLKQDLDEIHKDWTHLFESKADLKNPKFLGKIAHDIVNLNQDAVEALHDEKLKEKAELVHFLLTTPWGAPFIGEATLLDAAKSYKEGESDSALLHLMTGFMQHGSEQHTALFNFFDEISQDIA